MNERPLTQDELRAAEASVLAEKLELMLTLVRTDAQEHAGRAHRAADAAWPAGPWAPAFDVCLSAEALLKKVEAMLDDVRPMLADVIAREARAAQERAGWQQVCH